MTLHRLSAPPAGRPAPRRRQQRGTVLLFALVALTILLVSAVALVRSFGTTMVNAGNLAFKRDMTNQAERVWPKVTELMQTGALATAALRANHSIDNNYYAQTLPTVAPRSRGIPEALFNDTAFAGVGRTSNDIGVDDQQITIRYVIDRLCSATGLDSALGADRCTLADSGAPVGVSASELQNAQNSSAGGAGALPKQVVYRISIRVTGPRNTQSFYQTTFSL